MQARTAAPKDNMDDNIDEIEELEGFSEHPDETGVSLDAFITLHHMIAINHNEKRKDKDGTVTKLIRGTVEEIIAI